MRCGGVDAHEYINKKRACGNRLRHKIISDSVPIIAQGKEKSNGKCKD